MFIRRLISKCYSSVQMSSLRYHNTLICNGNRKTQLFLAVVTGLLKTATIYDGTQAAT